MALTEGPCGAPAELQGAPNLRRPLHCERAAGHEGPHWVQLTVLWDDDGRPVGEHVNIEWAHPS